MKRRDRSARKEYGAVLTALKKRILKTRRKAKFAGTLYLLGTIILAALTFMPMMLINGTALGVSNFYNPILNIVNGGALDTAGILNFVIAVLYALLLLTVVINVIKCLTKLRWLRKKLPSREYGFNRNMYAMEAMGDIFSGTFAVIINIYLLIFVFASGLEKAPALNGMMPYIALVVGLLVHFWAGLVGAKGVLFDHLRGFAEEKRTNGLFVFFVRNVIQVVLVFLMLNTFLPVYKGHEVIVSVLSGNLNMADMNALFTVVSSVIQLIMILFTWVLIKHTTATTEFNREGMDGKGMKNFRVFSFLIFLCSIIVLALPMLGGGELNTAIAVVAAIAFVGFLLDCLIRTIEKKEKEVEVLGISFFQMEEDLAQPQCQQESQPQVQYLPSVAVQAQTQTQTQAQQSPVYVCPYHNTII
ncbi:MAG: hypothetical protein IJV85_05410 [Clostridia bacterium]|nr:hypothetical protein [Clostridia bacterium]